MTCMAGDTGPQRRKIDMQDQELTFQPGCEDELNTGLLSVAQARARILAAVAPVRTAEALPLLDKQAKLVEQFADA